MHRGFIAPPPERPLSFVSLGFRYKRKPCLVTNVSPRRVAAERAVVALSALVVILVAALGLVLVSAPQSTIKTVTVTSTVTPAVQSTESVGASFAQHLVLFSSRNVSAIISQYEPNATVVWEHLFCWSGLYQNAGSSNGDVAKLLPDFFHGQFSAPLNSIYAGNSTKMTVVPLANGTVVVNSTFGLVGLAYTGNFTATVSAQDSFVYSSSNNAWMISQETWNFLTYSIPDNALVCSIG
jgi:hypothetical protein